MIFGLYGYGWPLARTEEPPATTGKGETMERRLITDAGGRFNVELEVAGTLGEALSNELAEPLLHCAMLAALGALAQEGPWPIALLDAIAEFMQAMQDTLQGDALM